MIKKIRSKDLDLIAANDISKEGIGFNSDNNKMVIKIIDISSNSNPSNIFKNTKIITFSKNKFEKNFNS